MKNRSGISVIIPVYNGEGFIRQALDSILEQTQKADEVIVVDDGSEDQTAKIVSEYAPHVQLVSQEKQNAFAARNRAIEIAKGDLLAFADADDICTARRLEVQARELRENENLEVVFGHMIEFHDGSEADPNTLDSAKNESKAGCCPGAMMARKTLFTSIGLFPTSWNLAGFMDWYLRCKEAGVQMKMLADTVLYRRIHANNSGKEYVKLRATEFAEVISLSLQRKAKQSEDEQ